MTEVSAAGGEYYLIRYDGNDCGGLMSHLMHIPHEGERSWLGLRCSSTRGVGFQCVGNNDRIAARVTKYGRYEGIESRSPTTAFGQLQLGKPCTGAWKVTATIVEEVPTPTD